MRIKLEGDWYVLTLGNAVLYRARTRKEVQDWMRDNT